jgi:ubiquinone/menaquinone biosynthesis C-methylase UbiE
VVAQIANQEWTTQQARTAVRSLMPVEADLAFRRRCETVVEFLQAGPEARILDCGCGYGFLLRILAEMTGAQIVGLDSDLARLEHARSSLQRYQRVEYVAGDAEHLPFADEEFTHVVCSEVLEHLDDDHGAVAELYRVLVPGGVVAVTVPSASYPCAWDPLNFVLERLIGKHLGGERPWSGIWYGHKRLYRPEQLRTLLEGGGFKIEEERPLSHSCPPLAHLLLYGLLKPLLMRGLLPRRFASAGDRLNAPSAPPRGAIDHIMRALEWIDRPNDALDVSERKQTFVALSIKARKPA